MITLAEVARALQGCWRLARLDPAGMDFFDKTITGFWSALDAQTGEILWQRPLPTDGRPPVDETPEPDPAGSATQGTVETIEFQLPPEVR